jgi:4a-hydroxytetrahydrobiopterin dehydratase
MERLSESEVEQKLAALPEWSLVSEAIQRTYQFEGFVTSMRFVNAVADEAERAQHHPDVLIRYNKVTLTLSTHDAGGITQKDFDLAARADALAPPSPPAAPVAAPAKPQAKKGKK